MSFGRVEVDKNPCVLMEQLQETEVWKSSLTAAETLPAMQHVAGQQLACC